jgi:hypothetical protein
VESPARVFGAVLGLTAFAVASVAALASGVPGSESLVRAMLSMAVCYPVGMLLGCAAGRAIDEHIRSHEENTPIPDVKDVANMYEIETEAS